MRRLFAVAVAVSVSVLGLCALSAQAQGNYVNAVGNPPSSVNIPIEGGFINVTNGNVHIEIPLATNKQRGNLQLDERLVYDSRIWTIDNYTSSWMPTNVPNSAAGWRFVSGGESGSATSTVYETEPNPCNPYDSGGIEDSYYVWYDNDGTAHLFNANWTTIVPGNDNDDCSEMEEGPESTTGSALDSSGYMIELSGDNYYPASTVVILDSNGNQVYPNAQDRYGNYFSTDGSGELIDTLGRTPVEGTQSGNVTTLSVLGFGDTRYPYTVTEEPIGVSTGFGQSGVSEWSGTLYAIYSIGLPDGSSYSFSYDSYGEMTSMTLPTGGVVHFGYTDYLDSYQNENRWLTSYSGGHGSLTFTPSVLTQCSGPTDVNCMEQMKVTDASSVANDRVYTLRINNGAWNTETAYYNGSAGSGNKLIDNQITYNFSGTCPYYCVGAVDVTPEDSDTTLSDVGYTTQTETIVNSVTNQLQSEMQWDYSSGSGSPSGSPLTDTEYTYNAGYSLPDNLTEVQVCNVACSGSGTSTSSNTVSQTLYNYTGAATTTSGIPNHQVPADTYLPSPYLGSVQQWISGTGMANNYLTTAYTNDDTGAQLTSTDPNNGQTTFSRDSTDSYVTTMTPPTPSSGVSLLQSATYDPSTGLVTSTTDPNGETTTYTYDWAGRPLSIHYPDGGSETLSYPSPTTTVDSRAMTASQSAQTQTLLDGYGRLSRVEVANGQGTNPWYQTDYCYDANGRLSFQSYQYQGPGWTQPPVCSGAGDAYSYDALGRTTQVLHADGSAITYAYAGRATQVTDENGVSRISQVDGLGRTTAVCEISSNSSMPNSGSPVNCGLDLPGTGFLTTYTYNLAGHTTTVNQGGQIRTFTTDGVGRTVSVTEPESGTTNYSYAYAGSGGLGLTVTRTRPQANQTNASVLTTTTTQDDSVGRPVTVSYNDGITLNKYFVYDQSTVGGMSTGAGKGRLTEAATTAEAEAFVYDPMGRMLNEAQCIPGGCTTTAYYTPFSYDWMGNVTSADDGSGAVSTYTYSPANEVISITSSLNDSTHQPELVSNVLNGPDGPVSWQLGNGLSVLRLYDSLGRTQQEWVCNVTASVGCGGSGNVLNGYFVNWRGTQASYTSDTYFSQDRDYTYDDFNRLATMSDSDTEQQLYNWVYDRWGNRWQQNASTGGFSFLTSYNTAANQINVLGYTYDAAGNLMNDSTFAYTYDADGNMLQFGPSDGSGTPVIYQYNALNQRVREDEDGNSAGYVFNPAGQRSMIWNMATGVESRGDTYWAGLPVEFATSSQANYIHRNWQNTETVITGSNGLAEALYHYLPYGDFSGWDGTPLNPPAFAGMDEEYYNGADSGMDHAQFRQYHNWYARWLSPDLDSGSYDFSNPQSLNRYTYAMNNPNVFTDPSGLCDPVENDGPCPQPPPDPPINPCDYVNCLSGIYGPVNPIGGRGPTGPGFPTARSFVSRNRPANKAACSAAQKAAAELASAFQSASESTGWIAFGAGASTALSGVGEGVTFGVDTPVTVTFASITGFFGTASVFTGEAGAVLNSFASGNLTALQDFGWSQLTNLAAKAAASKIPTIEPWSDTIGDLAERASDLTNSAQEVCR